MTNTLDQIFVLLKHWVVGFLPMWLQPIVGALLSVVAILAVFPGLFAISVLLERKGLGRMQNRIGPNRVGPFGVLQPVADGIKALINLRGPNPRYSWWRYETRVSAERGAAHLDVMLDSRSLPTRPMLAALFDAFDAAPRPFLVKCSGGQDRTSLAAALYLVHRGGWAARAAAQAQFARWPYLHFPKEHQRWLTRFLDFAVADSSGRPIADWEFQKVQCSRPRRLR